MENNVGRPIAQQPVRGYEALELPDASLAQSYLDEADVVTVRRERAVDRRALARLQIVNAVAIAAFLVAMAAAIRADESATYQVMLFSLLIWGQLASGVVQRSGVQWRLTSSRWPVLAGGGVLLVAALVTFGFVAFDPALPAISIVTPAALVLVGFGGYGVLELLRAPITQTHARNAPLPQGARWGTVLVGVALALLTMLAAAPEGALSTTLLLLVVLMIVAWIAAARSDMGLPQVGAAWRWPHLAVFGVSAGALMLLSLLDGLPSLLGVLSGAGMILLFVAVSFVPGHGPRG